jgi:RimJ/RimL family protein N-acetyltransferase
MTSVIFIPRTDRNTKRALINEISEAVFGTDEQSYFSEEFVPVRCRVPEPKVQVFSNFLINQAKLLWAVQFDGKTVGFILISDLPHSNSVGFSIHSDYARKGICSTAFDLIRNAPEILFPLYGATSTRNVNAQLFMEKQGFEREANTFDFCGEESFKYRLDRP